MTQPKPKLTKAELIETICESTGQTRKDIHMILDAFMDTVKDSLIQDHAIELRGLGTFEIKTLKGRAKARNPKTGQTVAVENHGVVAFRPGKELKKSTWDIRRSQTGIGQSIPKPAALKTDKQESTMYVADMIAEFASDTSKSGLPG